MTCDFVLSLREWVPIRDCPGRFVLRGTSPNLSLEGLLGADVLVRRCASPHAPDAIFVAVLEDGGLISYLKPEGIWTHTLGTREGFARKLKQLEITGLHQPL